MHEKLPTIPIPLLAPDGDVPLDLSHAIQQVYEEADYDLTMPPAHGTCSITVANCYPQP